MIAWQTVIVACVAVLAFALLAARHVEPEVIGAVATAAVLVVGAMEKIYAAKKGGDA